MRHHKYNSDFKFVIDPIEFDKYTEKDVLQYCLGATMYMPGTKDFASMVLTNKFVGLTSIVLCFEDACKKEDVPAAEENVIKSLEYIAEKIENNEFDYNNLPLIFFRVRSRKQFRNFAQKLSKQHLKLLTGVNFPKFTSVRGIEYFEILEELNIKHNEVLYGLPIFEDRIIAYKESRIEELLKCKSILDDYRHLILGLRVGATDFSSYFGMRRGVEYTIYDVLAVRDILSDILNIFSRDNDYVISGPVWEYFLANKDMKFKELPDSTLNRSILLRETIVDDTIDGLLREVILDKANGFIGKTCIHPSHIKVVNSMQTVLNEEYLDAIQILNATGGVIKSHNANKMNEVKPHLKWAEKTIMRAKAYGVIKHETQYIELMTNK